MSEMSIIYRRLLSLTRLLCNKSSKANSQHFFYVNFMSSIQLDTFYLSNIKLVTVLEIFFGFMLQGFSF